MVDSDSSQDGAHRRQRRMRGKTYAEIIQQLSDKVDHLHEELSQLQLENRDLKLRQEVLEQWCRINRLALQVMHTCGGVLMHGHQQHLSQAAVAAIEGAEEWIQQQLVDPGPVPADEAAELPLPQGGTGSSSSCTLQGHALSLQEYAVRCLLAHPERYAFISGLTDPDDALAEIAGWREHARNLVSSLEQPAVPEKSVSAPETTHSKCNTTSVPPTAPGSWTAVAVAPCSSAAPSPTQGGALARTKSEAGAGAGSTAMELFQTTTPPTSGSAVVLGGCAESKSSIQQQPSAALMDAPPAAVHEAALQELAVLMLHVLTAVACSQLVDPAITYRCVQRAAQLAGPLTQSILQSYVAALGLSQEQRAQIAARVRVVSQLLAPVNAAWDEVLRQMREVLLSMQQQQQQQQQRGQAPVLASAAVPFTAAAAAAAAGGGGAEGGTADAAAPDLHTRLSKLVVRLNTLHRTLGWLEMTQGYAGLGVLTWQQMGQLLVVTDPYPMLPRYVVEHIMLQWEEEHKQCGVGGSSNGGRGGLQGGWSQRLRPRNMDGQVLLQHSMDMDKTPPQQQQQQQQTAASMQGASSQGARSSSPAQHKHHRDHYVIRGNSVQQPVSGAGSTNSMQLLPGGDGSSPPDSQACAALTASATNPTHAAELAPGAPQQDPPNNSTHPHVHDRQQQQQQQQLGCVRSPTMNTEQGGLQSSRMTTCANGAGLVAGVAPSPLPAQPALHMAGTPSEVQRGGRLPDVPAPHLAGGTQGSQRGGLLQNLLELCDVVLEGGPEGVPGQEEGAALDALLDMLLD